MKDYPACRRCRHPIAQDVRGGKPGEHDIREWNHARPFFLASLPLTADRPYELTAVLTARCRTRFCLCRRPEPRAATVQNPGTLPFFTLDVWEAAALKAGNYLYTYRKLEYVSSGGPRYPDEFAAIAVRRGLIRSIRVAEVWITYRGLIKTDWMMSGSVWMDHHDGYSGFLSREDQIASFERNSDMKTPGAGNTLVSYSIRKVK